MCGCALYWYMSIPDQEPIRTRASLLGRLKDWNDQASWQEFYDTYHQLIFNYALKQGLTEAEAQDVMQETLLAVAKAIRSYEYDPTRSSFKNWLLTVTRHRIADHFRKRRHEPARVHTQPRDTCRTSTVERGPDPHSESLDGAWEEEWQRHLTHLALERLKTQMNTQHFQIFYLSVIKQQPAGTVAKALGVNRGQVYLVKHRLLPVFKKTLASAMEDLGVS